MDQRAVETGTLRRNDERLANERVGIFNPDEFEKLSNDKKERIQSTVADLQDSLQKILRMFPVWRRESREKVKALNQEVARFAATHLIDDLREQYKGLPEVLRYLDAVEQDIIERVDLAMGAAWRAVSVRPDAALRQAMLADLEAISTEALTVDDLDTDKVFLLVVKGRPVGYTVIARELDVRTRTFGTTVQLVAGQATLLRDVLFAAMRRAFAPLALLEEAEDDRLGNWRITAQGMLRRDRFVIDSLRSRPDPVPTVIVLAGGYGQEAWRYSARFMSTLVHTGRPVEPPETGWLRLEQFRKIARLLDAAELTHEPANSWQLTEEDIDELYSQVRLSLATLEFPGYSRGALILLNEFFDALETVADWCENTVDIVRAIAVRTQ